MKPDCPANWKNSRLLRTKGTDNFNPLLVKEGKRGGFIIIFSQLK